MVGQKVRPLTTIIFKTSESICVNFSTLQQCFVLNTFVDSVLNKFITQVAPPSDGQQQGFSLAKSSETTAFERPHL